MPFSLTYILQLFPRIKDSLFNFNKYGDAVVETQVVRPQVIRSKEFFTQLGYLVDLWTFTEVKGVEVVVHPWDADLVPGLVKGGYKFYKVVDQYLVLNRWIAPGPSRFPSHQITLMSVSGLVVDNAGRILMIREKRRSDCWKFPGGIPIENESVYATAKRTVKEKTGVTGVANAIISINHNNKVELLYATVSGMFFACLMEYRYGDAIAHGEDVLEAAWFTRAKLQELDHKKFFKPHIRVFNDYERLIESGSISPTGNVNARSMAYNFRR